MSDWPIIQAAKGGNISVIKKASKKDLQKYDEDGWCAIHWAAWSGNKDAVYVILNKQ